MGNSGRTWGHVWTLKDGTPVEELALWILCKKCGREIAYNSEHSRRCPQSTGTTTTEPIVK